MEIKVFKKDLKTSDQTYFLLFDIRMKCMFKQIKHQFGKLFQMNLFLPLRSDSLPDIEN